MVITYPYYMPIGVHVFRNRTPSTYNIRFNFVLFVGSLIFITCKAYSKNMIYDESKWLGMTRFEIQSD